jgi:hypothetical protein
MTMPQKKAVKTTKAVKANQKHRSLRAPKSRNRAVWYSVTGVLILAVVLGSFFLITNVLSPAFKYRIALSLLDDGQLTEACAILAQLGHYRDSDAYLELYSRQIMLNAEIGDIVYWGRYEQDNRVENGKEIIQWLVLDKKQNQMLLLSEKSLDEKPYNMKAADVTWETCTLRDWLNNTFIHEAFSSGEKSVIIRTELINEDNAEFGTDGGNNTFDNVFILSLNEVKIYLPEEASRLGSETTFAIFQYGNLNVNFPTWWLRSPGIDNNRAMTVAETGEIMTDGSFVDFNEPIRPAIWVDLSSDVFVR